MNDMRSNKHKLIITREIDYGERRHENLYIYIYIESFKRIEDHENISTEMDCSKNWKNN